MIFDEIAREGVEPSDQLIGKFDYLNTSARIEAGRIRELLEDWILRYPAQYRREIGADRRMREAIQAIDDVISPDFFLDLSTRGVPERPVAIKRLRRRVQEFVDELDYDAAVRAFQRNEQYGPIFQHEEHGARFRIRVVPKNTRTEGGRAIGGRILPGGMVQPNLHIKSSIESKAGRYGNLEIPLIIAINALNDYANYNDAVNAVFGSDAVVIPENGPERWIRNRDGAWMGPGGPVYTRCSGVLFFRRLSPWSIAQRTPRLILNPWAQNPLITHPPNIQVGNVEDEYLHWEQGLSLQQIFELTDGWPE